MRVHRPLAFLAVVFLLTQPAWAAPRSGGSTPHPALGGLSGVPAEVPNPITPQFNDPGPQLTPVQPGNPVQQLSPLGNSGQPASPHYADQFGAWLAGEYHVVSLNRSDVERDAENTTILHRQA